jgi:flagellar FliL protein
MEVMARDEAVIENVKTHMPVIRNNLVLVFSNQNYETISTSAGKQKLRDEALAEIQQILKSETGKTGVEAIYFTSFVMQ